MGQTRQDLSGQFFIDILASGHVNIRERGTRNKTGGLPAFSTTTEEEAKDLIVKHCKLSDDNETYVMYPWQAGNIQEIDRAAELFRGSYNQEKKG